jgi:hypothetical protein
MQLQEINKYGYFRDKPVEYRLKITKIEQEETHEG